jgi:3-phosphoshikimate 1-carboxyvinyltransferase
MTDLPLSITIQPQDWHRAISCPESKSDLQRMLLGALLANGESFIHVQSLNQDTETVIDLIRSLGADVMLEKNGLRIKGGLRFTESVLNVGESGLAARMFLPVLALSEHKLLLYGSGSLRNRSQIGIIDFLVDMGVDLEWVNNGLPVYVQGPIKPGNYIIDASLSSQFLSGLLFTLPLLSQDSHLQVNHLMSKPYIDLTIKVLGDFSIQIYQDDYTHFVIPGNQQFQSGEFFPEGDWSAAAFFIVAGILAGSVTLANLNPHSPQGDKCVLDFIPKSAFSWENGLLRVHKTSRIPCFQADLSHTPDLFPPLVALAAYANGTSILYGADRLVNKESNRLETLISEFSSLGINLWEEENCLMIEGGKLSGGVVRSHNDHRIAMALAVAALKASDAVVIEGANAVAKSYPGFWTDFLSTNSGKSI